MFMSALVSSFISFFIFSQVNYPLPSPSVVFAGPKIFFSQLKPAIPRLPDFLPAKGMVLGAVEAAMPTVRGGVLPLGQDKPQGPKKIAEAEDFKITARSAVAQSNEDNFSFFSYESDQVMPIASLTKLMTTLVFLEHNPGWDKVYELTKEDRREGGRIYLFLGEKVLVKDLFHLSLVASDNTATIALVHSTGLSEEEFVAKMNEKATSLGLSKTQFKDAVGLNNDNVSTAEEMSMLAKVSLAQEDIEQATLRKDYRFKTLNGAQKYVSSTDYLLRDFTSANLSLVGGKTGYTDVAGYCFVGKFVDKAGKAIITVILGGKTSDERFEETKNLAEWVYDSFQWPVVKNQ